MAKFDSRKTRVGGVVGFNGNTTLNYEGVEATTRNSKSELFLLGVTNFVSVDTFYEGSKDRDSRYKNLVHTVTKEDPTWVAEFVKYLRGTANMRSVSIVTAAEYVRAGGPNGRAVVSDAMQRADEPGEFLAYWHSEYGRSIPAAVKRGVADAARRLYNEKSFIKYDSSRNNYRFADVIQLAHVKPKDDKQSALFKLALDSRYNNDTEAVVSGLPIVSKYRTYNKREDSEAVRKELLENPEALVASGMTWESLSSFGVMDSDAWSAIIPQMGYMALLRNLRNFDQAGVSGSVANSVISRLTDPDEVARSRQLPFRFYSAYHNAPSDRWKYALGQALDLSLKNMPKLGGSSLILVDTSGSMSWGGYGYGGGASRSMQPLVQAALFGAALTLSGSDTSMFVFADYAKEYTYPKGQSVLKTAGDLVAKSGDVGHGTDIAGALNMWDGHDRVFLLSDMQTQHYVESSRNLIPKDVPIYGYNLDGYDSTLSVPDQNFYEFGGLTDNMFSLIPRIESGRSGVWPWVS